MCPSNRGSVRNPDHLRVVPVYVVRARPVSCCLCRQMLRCGPSWLESRNEYIRTCSTVLPLCFDETIRFKLWYPSSRNDSDVNGLRTKNNESQMNHGNGLKETVLGNCGLVDQGPATSGVDQWSTVLFSHLSGSVKHLELASFLAPRFPCRTQGCIGETYFSAAKVYLLRPIPALPHL